MDTTLIGEIAVIVLCLAAGGLLKGAIGVGAPIMAVPAMAAFFDVRFAIVVMLIPNIFTNIGQAFVYRRALPSWRFMVPLLLGGGAGLLLGTMLLRTLPPSALSLALAMVVMAYLANRMIQPDWVLATRMGQAITFPIGLAAGVLQGATGISSPVLIAFLNAMRLGREAFAATISAFFIGFGVFQYLAIQSAGLIRGGELWYGVGAIIPVVAAMPFGAMLARRASAWALDRLMLIVLTSITAKLVYDAVVSWA